MVIDILCGVFLADHAFVHHDHPCPQRHCRFLAVCRVDHCDPELTVDVCKFFSHHFLNIRIRLRDRAVQEQDPRAAHQGTSEKDTICISG